MKRQNSKAALNERTRAFILEQTGLTITDCEAEEFRRWYAQYGRLLIEISENQPEEEHALTRQIN